MNRNIRKKIGEETVLILEQGYYVSEKGTHVDVRDEIAYTKEHTVLYRPESFDEIQIKQKYETELEVIEATSLDGAYAYLDEGHVGLLNFASAKNPGGGFLGGSQAQEESLARSSTLYASLMSAWDYYEINRKSKNALYTHHIIYSPQVTVIRSEEGVLLEQPYRVSMITAPAVNAGALRKNHPSYVHQLEETMRQRMRYIFKVAAAQDIEILVLGAWGCGVFRNNPQDIARYFKEELADQQGLFKKVVFAIYDSTTDKDILTAFKKEIL